PPIGTFYRPDGEQMLVHRCAGCGAERHNRIAADDDPVTLLRLAPIPPRHGKRARQVEPDQVAS
ncbi:MAG TPA: RNHCP domain-containing protein, partial [Thermomicrobiales bacterium]|nr:RNHCP domain-containing protein [Thermomicrobiales bacterium]